MYFTSSILTRKVVDVNTVSPGLFWIFCSPVLLPWGASLLKAANKNATCKEYGVKTLWAEEKVVTQIKRQTSNISSIQTLHNYIKARVCWLQHPLQLNYKNRPICIAFQSVSRKQNRWKKFKIIIKRKLFSSFEHIKWEQPSLPGGLAPSFWRQYQGEKGLSPEK